MVEEQTLGQDADRSANKRLDIVNTIILAFASLLLAWNGYEATQWNSEQAEANNAALVARFAATRASSTGDQRQLIDIVSFAHWLDAALAGEVETAGYYRSHFRSEFQPAFDAWLATEPLTDPAAPINPFVMPDYTLADLQRAEELEQEAFTWASRAQEAGNASELYIQNTLYVSVGLFFAGLARTFDRARPQVVMLVIASLILVFGMLTAFRLPIA